MKWYNYLAAFFSGLFLTNFIPHFINGISGNPFPTPFANPPGKGLSSPLLNIGWAIFNLLVGFALLKASKGAGKERMGRALFFTGFVLMSVMLSIAFADKAKF